MNSSTVDPAVAVPARYRSLLSERHRPLAIVYGLIVVILIVAVAAIPLMKAHTKPDDHYVDISLQGNRTIPFVESRAALAVASMATRPR